MKEYVVLETDTGEYKIHNAYYDEIFELAEANADKKQRTYKIFGLVQTVVPAPKPGFKVGDKARLVDYSGLLKPELEYCGMVGKVTYVGGRRLTVLFADGKSFAMHAARFELIPPDMMKDGFVLADAEDYLIEVAAEGACHWYGSLNNMQIKGRWDKAADSFLVGNAGYIPAEHSKIIREL